MDGIFRVNVERCIACGKCELACAFAHGDDPLQDEAQRVSRLPGTPRIRVLRRGPERGIPLTCLQCHEAACMALCPTEALVRDEESGAIRLLDERCIRCGMCVAACPFGNMAWDEARHRAAKCDLCGGDPRCVPFCPTQALEFLPAELAERLSGSARPSAGLPVPTA